MSLLKPKLGGQNAKLEGLITMSQQELQLLKIMEKLSIKQRQSEASNSSMELYHMLAIGPMICGSNMPVWEQFYVYSSHFGFPRCWLSRSLESCMSNTLLKLDSLPPSGLILSGTELE